MRNPSTTITASDRDNSRSSIIKRIELMLLANLAIEFSTESALEERIARIIMVDTTLERDTIHLTLFQLVRDGYVEIRKSPVFDKDRSKTFHITEIGKMYLKGKILECVNLVEDKTSNFEAGLHWISLIPKDEALWALKNRSELIKNKLELMEAIRSAQQPIPWQSDALFELNARMMQSEIDFIDWFCERLLETMMRKPY